MKSKSIPILLGAMSIICIVLGILFMNSESYSNLGKENEEFFDLKVEESGVSENKTVTTIPEGIKDPVFLEDSLHYITKESTDVFDFATHENIGLLSKGIVVENLDITKENLVIQVENSKGYIPLSKLDKTESETNAEEFEFEMETIETTKVTDFYIEEDFKTVGYQSEAHRIHKVIKTNEYSYQVRIGNTDFFVKKEDVIKFKGLPVLMYHHLLKDSENENFRTSTTITPEQFEKEMNHLSTEGYKSIKPDDLYDFLKGELNLSSKSVLITFDDGLKSNLLYAAPVLRKYGLNATNFLITSRVKEDPTPFDPKRLQFLSFPELEEIKDVYNFEGHTHELHAYDTVSNKAKLVSLSREEIVFDLKKSKDTLKQSYLAYPFGQYNQESIEILEELDYKMAFTTKRGYVSFNDNLFELNRFGISPATTFEEFKNILVR